MSIRLENGVKQYVGPDGSIVPVIDVERIDVAALLLATQDLDISAKFTRTIIFSDLSRAHA